MGTEKLCLGTVQFGLHYGINNQTGKPSREQTFTMLDLAVERGICCFDTAAAYGDAESLLGEFLKSRKLSDKVKIISKLPPNIVDNRETQTDWIIKQELQASLDRLGINFLDGYLLHTPEYFYNQQVMRSLKDCQAQGLVRQIGVSIYDAQHALDVAISGEVEYIQVPYSILDQRLNRTDFFKIVKNNGMTVFARSAFLQGLFFMRDSEIPEHLAIVRKHFSKLDRILEKYALNRLEAAFLFSYSHPEIDYLVFGVDTPGQLLENLDLLDLKKDYQDCLTELQNQFSDIEASIIFPSLWEKNR